MGSRFLSLLFLVFSATVFASAQAEPCRGALAGFGLRAMQGLPISWKSSHDGSRLSLRLSTLENGLRFVTIHKSGKQVFYKREYGKLYCRCGGKHEVIEVFPSAISGADLGNGFRLVKVESIRLANGTETTRSLVHKTYYGDNSKIKFTYLITPDQQGKIKTLEAIYRAENDFKIRIKYADGVFTYAIVKHDKAETKVEFPSQLLEKILDAVLNQKEIDPAGLLVD